LPATTAAPAESGAPGDGASGICWITGVEVEAVDGAEATGAAGLGATGSALVGAFGAGSSKPGGSSDSGAFCASAQPELSATAVPSNKGNSFTLGFT
jgi:hypothetical protein